LRGWHQPIASDGGVVALPLSWHAAAGSLGLGQNAARSHVQQRHDVCAQEERAVVRTHFKPLPRTAPHHALCVTSLKFLFRFSQLDDMLEAARAKFEAPPSSLLTSIDSVIKLLS